MNTVSGAFGPMAPSRGRHGLCKPTGHRPAKCSGWEPGGGGACCELQLCPRGDTDHVTVTVKGQGLKPLPLHLTHDVECGGQEASAQCARCSGGCASRARGASLGGRARTCTHAHAVGLVAGTAFRTAPLAHVTYSTSKCDEEPSKSWSDTFDLDGYSGRPQLSGEP